MANTGSGNIILKQINFYWRILATGFCFAVFGLGGLVFLLTVFPLLNLLIRSKSRRSILARQIIRFSFRGFVELMNRVGVLCYDIRGLERLERQGLLILANHPTLIDTVFLMAFVKNADCIVKHSLWHNPFTRGPVRAAGYICNDNAEYLITDCIGSLQNNSNLTIFPEGTRTEGDGVIHFKRGAANIALRSHRNITPVVIQCVPSTLTKDEKWWQVPPTKAHFTIAVHDDITVEKFISARQLTDYLQDYFYERTTTRN
jgi:1-acyl-sn-glycerol-3-phosphate acyltransferase